MVPTYMQTLLYAHLHLDGVVHLRVCGESVNSEVKLLRHVCQSPHDGYSQKVPRDSGSGSNNKVTLCVNLI